MLHPQLVPDLSDSCAAAASLASIEAFGEHFARWRLYANNRCLSQSRVAKQSLVGPAMLATHIDPPVIARIAGKRISRPEKSHLHLLLAVPERFAINAFKDRLQKLWQLSTKTNPGVQGVNITKRNGVFESDEHVSNSVAYAARPIKARWSPSQILAAHNRLKFTPRKAVVRVLGAVTELAKLPHRTPITGHMYEFSHDEMRFMQIFEEGWK